jgi:hypothetical protein
VFQYLLISLISAYVEIKDRLVAYYQFESNANDESGNGYNGINYGNPLFATGKMSNALRLDGIDDYVFLPAFPGLLEATEKIIF